LRNILKFLNDIGKKSDLYPSLLPPAHFSLYHSLYRFNTEDSEGVVMNENRATCIMPWVEAEGWVDLELSLDGGPFYWKGKFFVGKLYCHRMR
jgi:hypothetical protein